MTTTNDDRLPSRRGRSMIILLITLLLIKLFLFLNDFSSYEKLKRNAAISSTRQQHSSSSDNSDNDNDDTDDDYGDEPIQIQITDAFRQLVDQPSRHRVGDLMLDVTILYQPIREAVQQVGVRGLIFDILSSNDFEHSLYRTPSEYKTYLTKCNKSHGYGCHEGDLWWVYHFIGVILTDLILEEEGYEIFWDYDEQIISSYYTDGLNYDNNMDTVMAMLLHNTQSLQAEYTNLNEASYHVQHALIWRYVERRRQQQLLDDSYPFELARLFCRGDGSRPKGTMGIKGIDHECFHGFGHAMFYSAVSKQLVGGDGQQKSSSEDSINNSSNNDQLFIRPHSGFRLSRESLCHLHKLCKGASPPPQKRQAMDPNDEASENDEQHCLGGAYHSLLLLKEELGYMTFKQIKSIIATIIEEGSPALCNDDDNDDTNNDVPHLVTPIETKEIAAGVNMPVLSIGTGGKEGKKKGYAIAKYWLSVGATGIDTSLKYTSHKVIRNAIEDANQTLPRKIPREDLFLTTKIPDCDASQTKAYVQRALEELAVSYVDLILIHQPRNGDCVATWKILETFYKTDKIRAIGVSNFRREHLEPILKSSMITPHVNQIKLNIAHRDMDTIQYASQHGIVIEAYSPLGQNKGEVVQHPVIKEIAALHKVSTYQIALRWIIQHGWVLTFQSSSKDHQISSADIFGFQLTKDEMDRLDRIGDPQGMGSDDDSSSNMMAH